MSDPLSVEQLTALADAAEPLREAGPRPRMLVEVETVLALIASLRQARTDADEARADRDGWSARCARLAEGWEAERLALAAVRAELADAHRALDAARDLHAPKRHYPELRFAPWCDECSTGIVSHSDDGSFTHKVRWPCKTAKTLGMVDPLAASRSSSPATTEATT